MRRPLHLAVLVAAACDGGATENRAQPVSLHEEARANARSDDPRTRRSGARTLLQTCCPYKGDPAPPEGDEACRELHRLFEHETEWEVLGEIMTSWGPACYDEFSTEEVLVGFDRPPPKQRDRPLTPGPTSLRASMVRRVGSMPPTPALVELLVAELARTDIEPDIVDPSDSHFTTPEMVAMGRSLARANVAITLSNLGEADLGPVVAALSSANPVIQFGAVEAFAFGTDAPLLLPAALEALERMAPLADPLDARAQPHLPASYARELRERNEEAADVIVGRLVEDDPDGAIVLLGRRQAFCDSAAAESALRQFAAEGQPHQIGPARVSLRVRKERCGRNTQ